MKKILEFWYLIRGHKPIGTILLWLPTAWALWIANNGTPDYKIIVYFSIGTFLMRSIGCAVNDRADRWIDPYVSRTCNRPLAAQRLTVKEADYLVGILLFFALLILVQLPVLCYYEAVIALGLTLSYPYFKRFFPMPQLILSLAFSMSIPMAYSASGKNFDFIMGVLWLLNCLWVIAYDTQYALVDKEDDLKVGAYSTAIFFGKFASSIIKVLLITVQGLWLYLAYYLHYAQGFYWLWGLAMGVLFYQFYLMQQATARDYWRAFLSNSIYGSLLWIGQMIQPTLI